MNDCKHFLGTVPNQTDGITYLACLNEGCDFVAGPVMCSGTEWMKCGAGETILPRRPCFHDEQKEQQWLKEYNEIHN